MTSNAVHATAKSAARSAPKALGAQKALGKLPEWNLADLYPALDSPELKGDLARAAAECRAFEATYKGKLAELAGSGGLAEAVKRYEALDDLLGRLYSYATLVYSGDTGDPVRTKFYGDVQDRLTAATTQRPVLHPRAQPHRRRGARRAPCRTRLSVITVRGSRMCARKSRTSWKTASSSCSTRSR